MRQRLTMALIFGCVMTAARVSSASDPAETVRNSEEVLSELMAIPARAIPHHLLTEAQGVAVIPDVMKIGFVGGVRRGHGVMFVRDADGEWSLPQFITLTGGSVGWQAGIQATDVVLIFKSRKGVEGLMKRRFTIGADASVSAGPIGRDAEAATDATLKAEILSYSRSRGLFAGVSIDGSALDVDHRAHLGFYGVPTGEAPRQLPESAVQLRNYLAELTQDNPQAAAPGEEAPPVISVRRLEALRRSLVHNSTQLHAILTPDWRQYLALPRDVLDPAGHPDLEALKGVEKRFAKVDGTPTYKGLAERPEFRATYDLLREYVAALSAPPPALPLPPPPAK